MMHRGSISWNSVSFTAFLFSFPFRVCCKGQNYRNWKKVVGTSVREEEPEGEDVAEEEGLGNNPHNKLAPLPQLMLIPSSSFLYLSEFSHILVLIPLTDESDKERVVKPKTKEEEELGIIHSWMEVGGLPALPEQEVQGLLWEVDLLFLSDTCMTVFLNCSFFTPHFTSPFLHFPSRS